MLFSSFRGRVQNPMAILRKNVLQNQLLMSCDVIVIFVKYV